jgi:aldose 1-epimerase
MARSRTGFALAGVLGLALAGSLGMRMAPAGVATAADHCSGPSVTKQAFGKAFDLYANKDLQVFRYTLANCNKMQVQIITYGATIQSIWVPDRAGHMADVVLGFKTLKEYVNEDSPDPRVATGGPYFGETIGRYGNRIANAKFSLDGHTYTLPANNGVNSLHGGFVGFGNHVWSATAVHPTGKAGVQMKLVSPNGDDGKNVKCSCTGYPGTLTVFTTFTLDNHNNLGIQYKATVAGKATVLNLTNHSYFNLAGEGSGVAYNQRVMINADRYTPVNTGLIPFGNLAPVKGTPFDFTHAKPIGQDIFDNNPQLLRAQGFDHNWVLNPNHGKGLNLAARAFDPASGRALTVWTDQPGVQFYTGNFLNGTLVGISGHIYRQTAGYTFETQHFPDSPNHHNFPSTELKPGQTFNSSTVFSFSH